MTSTPTPSGGGAERAAIAAYQEMWKDASVASRTADEHHPQLDDHASDGALGLLRVMQRETRKAGQVSAGEPKAAPDIVSAGNGQVELRDCVDGTGWVTYEKGADPKSAEPGGHHLTEATVTLTKSGWKVSKLFWRGAGSC
ncbi:hypothetical protein H9Y04_36295 [Streptomyces sp. TRM66268-LWL]|uniref:Secreted protein/lipoprotein n=1 Tax=Streptomyces polyasparticus TaxID=2767826 RepID=A0ABR7SRJ9_9ACTN|nr:hypothetical protein [Streptomyces polyasparticus]MBC9718008.1 hypothetical protein [Streptomyces polyasparticus]